MRHLGNASSEHQKYEKRAKAIEQNFMNLIICPCQCCRFVLSPYVLKKWKNIRTELPSVDLYTYTHNAARKEHNTLSSSSPDHTPLRPKPSEAAERTVWSHTFPQQLLSSQTQWLPSRCHVYLSDEDTQKIWFIQKCNIYFSNVQCFFFI